MEADEFHKQFMQSPAPIDRTLWDIGMTYHRLTENYDRVICTGVSERSGLAMPVGGAEFRLINQNAQLVKKMLREKYPWLSNTDLQHAIRDTARDFEIENRDRPTTPARET